MIKWVVADRETKRVFGRFTAEQFDAACAYADSLLDEGKSVGVYMAGTVIA